MQVEFLGFCGPLFGAPYPYFPREQTRRAKFHHGFGVMLVSVRIFRVFESAFSAFLAFWNLFRPLPFWGERDFPHCLHFTSHR